MTVVATAVQGFEERYTFYRNIFLYCGIAALVFLAIAIILFFVLKIPQVFGELTGRTARKAVEEMASGGTPTIKKKTDKKSKGKKETKKPANGTPSKKQVYSDLIGENDTPVRLVTHDDIPTPTLMPRREEETSIRKSLDWRDYRFGAGAEEDVFDGEKVVSAVYTDHSIRFPVQNGCPFDNRDST